VLKYKHVRKIKNSKLNHRVNNNVISNKMDNLMYALNETLPLMKASTYAELKLALFELHPYSKFPSNPD